MLLTPIFLVFYICYLILDPRLNIKIPSVEEGINDLPSVCLQKWSLVYLDDLKNYFLLTDHFEHFEDWLSEKKASGEIAGAGATSEGETLSINKEICLSPLVKNDCEELYCYQHKIPFSEVPPTLWKGLIGVEDYRFLKHAGIDWTSIMRALFIDLKSMKLVQGGSTLTQQLVKNLLLNNEKSFVRKFKEMVYSFYLEARYEKEDILAAYFNEVYWGGGASIFVRGIYGASLFYFGKAPGNLDDFEILILVAMLKGPQFYNPSLHLARLQERTHFVQQKLIERGLISSDITEYSWGQSHWLQWKKWFENKRQKENLQSIWYISKNVSQFSKNAVNPFEQLVLMQSVHRLQNKIKKQVKEKDLAFKAIIGDPFDKKGSEGPYYFYSKWERNSLRAIQEEKHQIGSLLKPLLYAIYQALGVNFDGPVSTAPVTLKLLSGAWSPREAHRPSAPTISVREALQKSLNTPPIRLAQYLGFEQLESKLHSYIPEMKRPLAQFPSQLLGSLEMSLEEVFDLYKRIIKEQCEGERSGRETILQVLSYPGITTVSGVIDGRLSGVRFFGKTGTSNKGFDNWYVAYDGHLLFVFWFGLEGKRVSDSTSLPLYGSTSSFRVFQDFFIHRGKPYPDFGCPKF